MKDQTVAEVVALICVEISGAPGVSAPQKFAIKTAGRNAPKKMTAMTKSRIGISLAMVVMTLSAAASCTPRRIRALSNQMIAEAQTIESRLLPSPKIGKK